MQQYGIKPLKPLHNKLNDCTFLKNISISLEIFVNQIFNRLGILIFESEDINIGWDGYFNDKKAPEGVYVYRITGLYNNGDEFSKVGSVMIIFTD